MVSLDRHILVQKGKIIIVTEVICMYSKLIIFHCQNLIITAPLFTSIITCSHSDLPSFTKNFLWWSVCISCGWPQWLPPSHPSVCLSQSRPGASSPRFAWVRRRASRPLSGRAPHRHWKAEQRGGGMLNKTVRVLLSLLHEEAWVIL